MRFTRRSFLGTAAAAAGSTAILTAMGRPAFAQETRIRHFWWGNPDRDERTLEAIRIFNEKHPDIEVIGETLGFADYFTRLTTQIAGGNMPDAIQMGYGVMFEYIERGALLPLDEYIGNQLDLTHIDQSAIDAGTVDGKLYALSIGANSHMAMYNKRLYEEAGIVPGEDFDPYGWTYDDVKRIGVAIKEATGVAGTDDNTADYQNFSDFAAQAGGELYTAEGEYGPTQEIVEQYWTIWKDIRDAGATPPAQHSAGLAAVSELSRMGVVTGDSATTYLWSNQLVGVQALMEDELGAAMYPNLPEMIPGSIIQPSQFICLSRDTVDAEATVTYMNAFVNDMDMTAALGLERGIPANSQVREMLQPTLEGAAATSVEFFDNIQGKTMDLHPPQPSGANEVEQTFERIAVGVLLEQQSIPDAAADFIRQAEAILRRAS
ncbi:MAG TPA: extracellular solute-binding protein [Devosia sp.]|jgi:multiple sugar transport system substrate-binding protein|nr:extracellular solute-binding protein [Devosia sp.]